MAQDALKVRQLVERSGKDKPDELDARNRNATVFGRISD